MNDAGTGWSDERVALLGKLWGEGLSASQIAAILGGGVTRNAVIGKVHRLGLAGRVKAGAPAQPRPAKPSRPVARPITLVSSVVDEGVDSEPARRETPPARVDDEIALPPSERVSIMDLRDSMCRWPIGDPAKPGFGFCGQRATPGVPYCAAHCRIAYQPVADRKRLRA